MRAKRTLKDKILPCYRHLFEPNDINIEFLWGTRDSGKSKAGGQLFIYEYAQTGQDFKGVLIRKVRDTIKDSIYSNVLSILHEWKLEQYFTNTKSPLEIRSLIDNGVILSRGMDEPGKIKSLSNPTHALVDEADQINADDFTTVLTTFRHNKIKPKFIVMFNPELPSGVQRKEDWWLYRDWFSHTDEKNFTHTKEIKYLDEIGIEQTLFIKYRSTHTTFNDNPFCPPERKAHYYNLQQTNPDKYLPYAKGEWGLRSTQNPFFYAFNESLHYVDERYKLSENTQIILSFDFNNNPTTLLIGQVDGKKISVFDLILADENTISGLSPLEAVCHKFKEKYLDSGLLVPAYIIVTGDATGRNKTADNSSNRGFYTKIKTILHLGDSQIKIRKQNITHVLSRELCNGLLYNTDFAIYKSAKLLCNGLNIAYADKDGSLNEAKKKYEKDGDTTFHIVDTFRYFCDCVLNFEKWQDYLAYYSRK